ncbi:MAG: BlaI/MecI/CopY family transcriptional regulator [Pseudomonadota bacterium]
MKKPRKNKTGAARSNGPLPKRERQVLDILHRRGKASVADVQLELPDKPSYSATRMLLQRLEKKDLARYEMQGAKYIYSPAEAKQHAVSRAWQRLVDIFFAGSTATAFSALFDATAENLTDQELAEIEEQIAQARTRRKQE